MSDRKPLIAGNWKMFKTSDEAAETVRQLVVKTSVDVKVEVMIAPPFTALSSVANVIRDSGIGLGAQNLHWEPEGAFTGEISASMLVAEGCQYVIIGHSERRHLFHETDASVNKKIKAAIHAGLFPILCVGETETERENEQTFTVLDKQVKSGLEGLTAAALASLVIAYEPVWAIGTGLSASPEQVQEVHGWIRSRLRERLPTQAEGLRILYGGSVKPGNISGLLAVEDVDGALVGGASLDPEAFAALIRAAPE